MEIATILISILSLVVALGSFWYNQRWKVLEFVGIEIRNFRANALNQAAMKMLDWDAAKYLHPELFENGNPKSITINNQHILEGLGPIGDKGTYTIEEKFVRDSFDVFFDSLETLETHVEQGLVTFKHYEPYLRYYIDIIVDDKNNRKNKVIRQALMSHMKAFKYKRAIKFCHRFQ